MVKVGDRYVMVKPWSALSRAYVGCCITVSQVRYNEYTYSFVWDDPNPGERYGGDWWCQRDLDDYFREETGPW